MRKPGDLHEATKQPTRKSDGLSIANSKIGLWNFSTASLFVHLAPGPCCIFALTTGASPFFEIRTAAALLMKWERRIP